MIDCQSLVQETRVHRRVYTDPAIFELELERIFDRVWLFVAHTSQLPERGSFVRTRMGRYEVLVTRDQDDRFHVLRNSCAHRGARLCGVDRGKANQLTCPYHAWNYQLDGTLRSVPHRDSYPASFALDDKAHWLQSAAQVDCYRGFIFASWAADQEPLKAFLGPMLTALDNLVDRAPDGELEQLGGQFSLIYPGNWKLHMENANDTVHPSFVHESSVHSARHASDDSDPQIRNMLAANGFTRREWDNIELHGFNQGHSYMGGFYKSGILSPDHDDPVSQDYRAKLVARCGEDQAQKVLAMDRFNNLIYPNLSVNAQFHQLRMVHPLSVDRTLIQAFCFRLKGAPEAIFHRAIRFLNTLNSPASLIFGDDIEIFSRCQQGLNQAGIEWLDVSRGLTTDSVTESGEAVSPGASELPIRVQMRAWLNYMSRDDNDSD